MERRSLSNTNLTVFHLIYAWMPLGAIREPSPGQKKEEESAHSCRDEEEQKKGREKEESKKRTSFSFWALIQHLSGT